MTEEQATTAVYQCAQAIKRDLGQEKALGLFVGCAIGEVILSGGSREDLDKLIDRAWEEFVKVQKGG